MKRNDILRAAVAALTLVLAAALIASTLFLYARGLSQRRESGDLTRALFTREAVAAQLRRLVPIFALWLAAWIAALAFGANRGAPPHSTRGPGREIPVDPPAVPSGRGRFPLLRIVLFACAIAMIVLGALNGGMNDVLVKAINICTECIGLG